MGEQPRAEVVAEAERRTKADLWAVHQAVAANAEPATLDRYVFEFEKLLCCDAHAMKMPLRPHVTRWLISGLLLLLVVISLWYALGINRRPRIVRRTITAGSVRGLRHAIGRTLAEYSAHHQVMLEMVVSAGSGEALERVDRGELDFALVQGGLPTSQFPNVRQAAVLHIEPLHLLVKGPLWEEASTHLSALRGRTVNLSSENSGTFALATDVLRFAGLEPGRDYEVATRSYTSLMEAKVSTSNLPDAIFTVSSLPSPIAKHLVTTHNFRPVELPLAEAFQLGWQQVEPGRLEEPSEGVIRRRISEATIPQMAYRVDPAVPEQKLRTLGCRLQLVVHRSVPAREVGQLLKVIYESPFSVQSPQPLRFELLATDAEFELHPGAERYLLDKSPIVTEKLVEVTEQLLAILGGVCGACLFVWQWYLVNRRKRRDREFLACIQRILEIENRAMQYELDASMTLQDLLRLQDELGILKQEMIRRFQDGGIEGADVVSAFLNHVNDTSELLTRLILHERPARTRTSLVEGEHSKDAGGH